MKTDSGSKVNMAVSYAEVAPQDLTGEGGNGEGTTVEVAEVPLVPQAPAEPIVAQVPPHPRGKRAPVQKGVSKVQAVLPEPQRAVLYKRLPDGSEAYMGEWTANEVLTGGGSVQSFIAQHLRQWLDPGVVNVFRCAMKTASGQEADHGQVKVMGDPIAPGQAQVSPQQPPQKTAETVSDTVRTIQMLQQFQERAEERERKRQAEDEERQRKQMEILTAASQQKGGGGDNTLMLMLMMQSMNRPAPPTPSASPVEQMALLEGMVNKLVSPIAQQQREFNDRLERIAMQTSAPPVLPEPPRDPAESFVRLVETLKPQPPTVPPLTPADVAKAVADAIRDTVPRKEEFGLKDVLALAPTVVPMISEALGVKRMQDEVSRLRDDLKEARTKPREDEFLTLVEKVKAFREASTMFGGGESATGWLAVLDRVLAPETLDGIQGLVATWRNPDQAQLESGEGGGEEGEDEQEAPKPKKRPAKPEDLARDTYPAGFDEQVAKMVEAGKGEAKSGEESQKAVFAVLGSLNHLLKNDMEWRNAIMGALMRISTGGPKALNAFIGTYLSNMAKQGKMPEDVAKNLIGVFKANANAIIAHIRDRIAGGGK